MKIEAGMLRETIAIQARTDTADDYGGFAGAWANVTGKSAVRAHIKPVSVRTMLMAETIMGGQISGTLTHEVTLHYDSAITRNHRISWGSRVLTILRINAWDVKHRWMTLECAEAA